MAEPDLTDADLKEWNDLTKAAADFEGRIRSDNELLRQITALSESHDTLPASTRGIYEANLTRAARARGITTEGMKYSDELLQTLLQQQLITAVQFNTTQLKTTYDRLFVGFPGVAVRAFPSEANKDRLTLSGIDIGGGTKRQVVQVLTASNGKVFTVMNSGEVVDHGVFPELAKGNYQAQVRRDGALVAFDPSDPSKPRVVIDRDFGFAEIDPQIKRTDMIGQFEANLAISKQQVAIQFAGVELQRRGLLVNAQSDFMAREIELGRLTYEEARTNLDRINIAFDQRRKDLVIQLQHAVSRTSLRTNAAGETVTALPLGAELAGILGVAPSNFELPVTAVNPDATGQAVLDASAFQSPQAGLRAQLDAARAAVAGIIGAPGASGLVADTAGQAAVQGV